jgi:uncharacterized protein YciI
MTGYAILFEDNVNCSEQRAKYMGEHLKFLEANGISIKAAGPLVDPETDNPAGGLWLVEARDAKAARALVEADPFWPTGLRKSVRILHWRQVFRDGVRQI